MSGLERARTAGAVVVDAAVYAAVVAAVAVVASTLVGFAAGGDWSTVKGILFVVGAVFLGYATARLWMTTPEWKREQTAEWGDGPSQSASTARPGRGSRFQFGTRVVPDGTRTRFQRFVERVPPRRWVEVSPRATLSPTGKVFLAGLFVMAISFGMETVFGV